MHEFLRMGLTFSQFSLILSTQVMLLNLRGLSPIESKNYVCLFAFTQHKYSSIFDPNLAQHDEDHIVLHTGVTM